ncbi:uncharacterized protein At5g65660 [Amborella trichopoda]|uniref:Hydroxyproline-rich glycoprotein family protein n=1 Tax=Amborella trichopoda TaxID=13333 RepID=W1PVV6_AMBTC|nr:uncharacterized protein At5g65660 [Amborella trichopoda]ERN11964.1 hypothetical protein AMTR_s00184p00038670 [Amborella trichopoda]|eukprot:XP_006850383.1 uncharacterized protein At5g65660 [Amborella trichopoda]
MDEQQISHRRLDASRPTLGFPLGTALLLILIFSISAFFSCCYHWDKIRNLRRPSSASAPPSASLSPPLRSPPSPAKGSKVNSSMSLPVLMPGDRIPKYIAWPCPCKCPAPNTVAVHVQE